MAQNGKGSETPVTPFKKAQVRHRRRGDDLYRVDDMGDWIDFGRGMDKENRIYRVNNVPDKTISDSVYKGPIFGLKGFQGFYFFPNALDEKVQKELAYKSVSEYCERPHCTNIDQVPPKASEEENLEDRMWDLWKESDDSSSTPRKKQKRSGDAKHDHHHRPKYRSFKKLSWATLGYHYDWTERTYHEGLQSDMPRMLGDLSTLFARTFLALEGAERLSFTPSASIVNYYSTKSNMGGHRDDLEFAMDKPIVSISMGLPAIFLLGGRTKEDKPVVPILIRKGDVLCMGGSSRLNYHAMARVLPAMVSIPECLPDSCPNPDEQISLQGLSTCATTLPEGENEHLTSFLTQHRININVRQVYPDDHDDNKEK